MKVLEATPVGSEPIWYPMTSNDADDSKPCITRLSVSYNDSEIIVTFDCKYSHPLSLPYTEPYSPVWNGEAVEFFISPNADKRHYYEFDTAPNGAFYDTEIINTGSIYVFTRIIKDTPVKRTTVMKDDSYTLTLTVPFSVMSEASTDCREMLWLVNAYRINYTDTRDRYAFSPTESVGFHVPDKFAQLIFR